MELDANALKLALRKHGVAYLFHANTVRTSCTFLTQCQLMSRGAVEAAGFPQTPQDSDALDKRFGIWFDIFLDSVDIHHRARRRNLYGPVLFAFDVETLAGPEIDKVWVSRRNPIHWRDGETDAERYYTSVQEFEAEFRYGDFFKHLMVRNRPSISLNRLIRIGVDNPQLTPNALYDDAMTALKAAAVEGGCIRADQVVERRCRQGCTCVQQYQQLGPAADDLFRS